MRVLMYQSGLGPKVVTGQKVTTIRAFTVRKDGSRGGGAKCKPGDILSHREWSGLPYRSKQRVLCESVCTNIFPMRIESDGYPWTGPVMIQLFQQLIAKDDGFASWDDLLDYFRKTHGLPFYGEIIRWSPESIKTP